DVLVGNCRQALLAQADFVYAALIVEALKSAPHISARELFNDRFQLRIALAHAFVEMGSRDSRFLELVIWPAGVHRFMLAHVADEQHAVFLGGHPKPTISRHLKTDN